MNEKKNLTQQFQSSNGSLTIHQTKKETILYIKGIRESFRIVLSHDEMSRKLTAIRQDINTAKRRHKTNLRRRDRFRHTLCNGCRHNYYNFPKMQSSRGDVAVSEDYYCWHIPNIRRGKCDIYR